MANGKFWSGTLGAFVTGFGAATLKEGSMTTGIIIAVIGLIIVFVSAKGK